VGRSPNLPPDLPPSRHSHLGWQPSRFLTARGQAEHAFALAERLGSVNAAAAELGTTWPSLRKAFTRHGLGMPTRNPEAVRQRAIAAARQRSGQPVAPPLDPVFVALNPKALPARPRSPAELHQWVRRDEEYATLGANVVVELNSESRARQPTTRAWAIIRRADRAHRRTTDRQGRGERRQPTVLPAATAPADPTNPRSGGWLPIPADPTRPKSSRRRRTARNSSLSGTFAGCVQAARALCDQVVGGVRVTVVVLCVPGVVRLVWHASGTARTMRGTLGH
jgi:hypothetical protein